MVGYLPNLACLMKHQFFTSLGKLHVELINDVILMPMEIHFLSFHVHRSVEAAKKCHGTFFNGAQQPFVSLQISNPEKSNKVSNIKEKSDSS